MIVAYSIRNCNLDYRNLEIEVFEALTAIGQAARLTRPIEIMPPIPIVTAISRDFVDHGIQCVMTTTGWRALILDNVGRPVACADIFPPTDQTEDPSPSFAVRGRDPALALGNVLQAARKVAEASSDLYDVSFLTFAPLFVTVLWLRGKDHLFFPTRIGGGGRPDITQYGLKDFLDLLNEKRATANVTEHPKRGTPTRDRLSQ